MIEHGGQTHQLAVLLQQMHHETLSERLLLMHDATH
jgi:hypothetical protein